LLGDANPSGHLPVSWPRSVGQEPLFYNHKIPQNPGNDVHRYWDMLSSPLYPFGYGLSYADFSVGGLSVITPSVKQSGSVRVSVQLHNGSAVGGAEVVQCYTHQRAGSASRPVRELKAFRKVTVAPNRTVMVELDIPASELAYWSPALHREVLEPGTFDLWVGTDASAKLHGTFDLAE